MGKQMRKSENLLDITEVCNYFGLSESTIRRKVRDSRDGRSNFPIPLFKEKHKLLWRKCDIENWGGDDCEDITLTPCLEACVRPKCNQEIHCLAFQGSITHQSLRHQLQFDPCFGVRGFHHKAKTRASAREEYN